MGAVAPMTYLQLCNRLIQKCGISGNPLATLQSATGEMARVVSWIDEAYLNIQQLQPDWDWMVGEVSFPTVAAQAFYTPAQCGLSDFAAWDEKSFRVYFNDPGIRSEVFLRWLDWADWRDTYLYGNLRLTAGMPVHVSMRPDNRALALGLLPDDRGYTVDGQYFRAPQALVADGDVPLLPARFHLLVVYQAMQYYGAYEAAAEVFAQGKEQYVKMMRRLVADELPRVEVGGPLC
jgi:hypothetical protein